MDKLIRNSPHSFVLQRRCYPIAPRTPSREPRFQGDGEEAFRCAVCSSRRVSGGFGPGPRRLGCRGDSRNTACRLRPRPAPGEPCYESARACTRCSCPRSGLRPSAARPDGRRSGWELHGTDRRGRPGWVLRFTGDDGEASGSAARLHRFRRFARKRGGYGGHWVPVQRRRRQGWVWLRIRSPAPLTPLAFPARIPVPSPFPLARVSR